jgi:predicted HicB family RNase H-like nuclease
MFTYKNYTAKVEIDTETKRLRGRVLNINDAVHFEGETVESTEQNFHKAIENYLQLCQKSGKDPEKPFSGKLPFRTTPDIHRTIHQAAALEEKSINAWMEETLGEAAKRTLKRQADATPLSDSVQRLLGDRSTIAALVMQVSPYLASKAPRAMARVLDALEKLLIGLSEIKPFLKGEDSDEVISVIREIESLATFATSSSAIPSGSLPVEAPKSIEVPKNAEVSTTAEGLRTQDPEGKPKESTPEKAEMQNGFIARLIR